MFLGVRHAFLSDLWGPRTRSAWEARVMSSRTLVFVLNKTNLKLQRFDYLSLIIEHDSHFTRYICFLFNCKTKDARALTYCITKRGRRFKISICATDRVTFMYDVNEGP